MCTLLQAPSLRPCVSVNFTLGDHAYDYPADVHGILKVQVSHDVVLDVALLHFYAFPKDTSGVEHRTHPLVPGCPFMTPGETPDNWGIYTPQQFVRRVVMIPNLAGGGAELQTPPLRLGTPPRPTFFRVHHFLT